MLLPLLVFSVAGSDQVWLSWRDRYSNDTLVVTCPHEKDGVSFTRVDAQFGKSTLSRTYKQLPVSEANLDLSWSRKSRPTRLVMIQLEPGAGKNGLLVIYLVRDSKLLEFPTHLALPWIPAKFDATAKSLSFEWFEYNTQKIWHDTYQIDLDLGTMKLMRHESLSGARRPPL